MADWDDVKDETEEKVDAADDKLHELKGQAEEKIDDAQEEAGDSSEEQV